MRSHLRMCNNTRSGAIRDRSRMIRFQTSGWSSILLEYLSVRFSNGKNNSQGLYMAPIDDSTGLLITRAKPVELFMYQINGSENSAISLKKVLDLGKKSVLNH